METKKGLRKFVTVWLACLILVLALAVPSTARELVELEKGCTLDLAYKYQSTLFEGEEVKVYKVASFTLDGMYELTGDFAAYPIEISNIKTQDEWNAVCDTLVAYVAADSLMPAATAKTNSDGVASFKKNWIDFNAFSMDEDGLFELILQTVNGKYTCKSEDVREIAFYKTGVTL